jgi:hypothetical protein
VLNDKLYSQGEKEECRLLEKELIDVYAALSISNYCDSEMGSKLVWYIKNSNNRFAE